MKCFMSIIFTMFISLSCSQGLDWLDRELFTSAAFSIQTNDIGGNTVRITWTETQSNAELFAYYVYRTQNSPYNNYQLIARLYNTSVTNVGTRNYTETRYTKDSNGNCTLSSSSTINVGIPVSAGVTNQALGALSYDDTVSGSTNSYYYRVIIYKFETSNPSDSGCPAGAKHEVNLDKASGFSNVTF